MTATIEAPKTLRERLAPRVQSRTEYLSSQAFFRTIIEIVSAAGISGYAVSRVTSHRLSPASTAIVLISAAAIGTLLVSIYAFFTALSDTVDGLVTKDGTEQPSPDGDPLSAPNLWGRALAFGAAGAAWGGGLTLLALATLNRRESHFLGLFVGVFIAAGVASVTSGIANTALGVRVGLDVPKSASSRPARRRAWRELALPWAVLVGGVTAAFTVLLFHDYRVGSQFASHVLTEKEGLADLPIQVVVAAWLASFALGRAGRAEAKLGLVTFEDPEVQDPKGAFGPQAQIYVVLIVLFIGGSVVRFFLPAYPTLVETVVARGIVAFVTAFLAGGIAYVRGAANAIGYLGSKR